MIAATLGRNPSTVSPEIRRNCNPAVGPTHAAYYRPFAAQKRAESRRPRSKERRLEICPALQAFVQAHLDEKWSPEQIANILRRGSSFSLFGPCGDRARSLRGCPWRLPRETDLNRSRRRTGRRGWPGTRSYWTCARSTGDGRAMLKG
ncbi:hypothetical protein [Streptomyces sp. NPDC097981]|uniref:hypothetical protein n=1 Tax=Streptomyces sp. NPDC097981 TaxID=3155428 RepID=UPI003327FEE3